MRQCIGCREKKPKKELIRVVRPPEGEVTLDFTGKSNGRGAYLCKDPACLKRAAKAKALEHALETVIPETVYEKLALQLENENENR
ncbi:MAG: YlxR family protein [Oscillospiraceae bacterium]|nr:YlxR family protein [Oscillospiraceae bacterium]